VEAMKEEKTNRIEDVAQIVWWNRIDDDHYQARVTYRDGTAGRYDHLTKEGWLLMKAAELGAELEELNAPGLTKVDERNPYERMNEAELGTLVDSRAEEVAAYAMQTKHFGLCSWCKSYYSNETGEIVCELTDEEYEPTTHPESGASHGVCPQCKSVLMKERR
jgi:hypothetical protein